MIGQREIKRFFIKSGDIGLPSAVFVLHLIIIKFSSVIPSHHFLFLFFFFTLILVPGYYLSRIFYPRIELPGRVLISYIFGIVSIFTALIVFELFHLDLLILGSAFPFLSVIIAIILKSRESDRVINDIELWVFPPVSKRTQVLLLLLIIFVSILIVSHGDPMLYTSDSAGQISYIRTISRSHEAFPDQNLYKDGGKLTKDIRKGLMHSTWGTINILTSRNDVFVIWSLISAICSCFTILAFFCAGWLIFKSPVIGILSALIFVFIYGGGLTSYRLITSAYSFPAGIIFSIAFLISVLVFLDSDRKDLLILMAASSFAGTGTHIGHIFVAAFIILYCVGGKLIESRYSDKRKSILRTATMIAVLTAGVNIPYLLMRYFRDYAPNNDIHTHLQGIFSFTRNLYTLNPIIYYKQSGILVILGLLAIFILWKYSRNNQKLRLLLWGNIALWLLLFNPVLFPALMKFITYLVMRLKVAVPVSLLVAVLFKVVWDRVSGKDKGLSSMAAIVGGLALLVCSGYQLAITPSNFAYSRKSGDVFRFSCMNISDLYEHINMQVPSGSVIASDPITSYCLPAFTDQFIICTNGQHSIPNDSTALDRIGKCRDIFSPLASMGDIVGMMKEYGAEYIVINGRIPRIILTMYWKPDRRMAEETIDRFMKSPSFFKPLYVSRDAALFEMIDEFLPEVSEAHGTYSGEQVLSGEVPDLIPSGTPGINIKAVHLDRQSIVRGEKLELDIEWVLDRKRDYMSYLVHVRFDTEFEKGMLFNERYGKIYRKILEKREGKRFRFRVGHLPFNGIFTPDRWPLMQVVRDRVNVNVPEDIATGEYIISVRMSENTHYPNYSLMDLLRNEDSFDGPDMARINIK